MAINLINYMRKRIIYYLLFVLSGSLFISCSQPDSSDEMMDLLVEYVEILKSTHINTQNDILELQEKIEVLYQKKDEAKKREDEMMNKMSVDERNEYAIKMMEKMERSGIKEESKKESDRIKKEAQKAGLEIGWL